MKFLIILASFGFFLSCNETPVETEPKKPEQNLPKPELLEVGYATGIGNFTTEKLNYASSTGIKHVEASGMGTFFGNDLKFKMSDEEMRNRLEKAKKAADDAGLNIWSIHMPFGSNIDLSVVNEEDRKKVVAAHSKLLEFLEILEPEIILFHPSYYLGQNERDTRKAQLIKSAKELDEKVRDIGATMVIENMLGPELQASGGRERPLMRTVEETKEIFSRLPNSIYSAIDMNHIKNPEELILAMGDKLKSVHIADGTGRAENHFFPCTGEGENDWNAILDALYEVEYTGPFMYESRPQDEKEYVECYEQLYNTYIEQL